MSDEEILHASYADVFDLSKEGEAWRFIDALPNSKGIIEPYDQRPPVVMFHTENDLNSATTRNLWKEMQREKLKQARSGDSKQIKIQKILQNKENRDMAGQSLGFCSCPTIY